MKRISLSQITVASVGHIDHGKSTLFGRLLYDSGQVKRDRVEEWKKEGGNFAFLLDNFEDEQKREMTIDIFYTQLKTRQSLFTLIDDPGHLEFIKNMLTGVSQASGVILVISAKPGEGIQFQTKRHLMLVRLLGIEKVLVVINKMDVVDYQQERFEEIKNEIGAFLIETGFNPQNISFLPASALKGDNVYKRSENMPWYQGKTLYELLDEVFVSPLPPVNKPLRACLQGAFEINGERVLFSKIETGRINLGQEVSFLPLGVKTKVLGIKKNSGHPPAAVAGEVVGLIVGDNIPEKIGDQIIGAIENQPRVRDAIAGQIFLLLDESIRAGDRLTFRCGTREIPSTINKIFKRINSETGEVIESNAEEIKPAEMADVEISFDSPTVVEKFSDFPSLGRFLLYRKKKNIAAGIVVD